MNYRFLPLLPIVLIFTLLFSCKEKGENPDTKKTPEQIATEALSGTGTAKWTVAGGGSVTRDGQNVTSTYAPKPIPLEIQPNYLMTTAHGVLLEPTLINLY
jgi:hypothetical protein